MSTERSKIIGPSRHNEKRSFGRGLTKLDIAKIQINSAVKMLFDNMDPISVHTVASSGYQIVRDLADKAKTQDYLMFTARIKKEHLNEFWSHVNKAWAFFKHANQDPEAIFEGAKEHVNDFAIFMAIKLYRSLGGALSAEMTAFSSWFICLWPQLLIEDDFRDFIEKSYKDCNADQFTREEILQMGKTILERIKSSPLPLG